jgi:hypothetical protein
MKKQEIKKKEITYKEVPEEMKSRISQMANTTWQQIASDVLTNDMGEPDYRKNLPRSHVVEIVCDADYMLYHGYDKEAYQYWCTLSWELRHRLVKEAFPFARYGW